MPSHKPMSKEEFIMQLLLLGFVLDNSGSNALYYIGELVAVISKYPPKNNIGTVFIRNGSTTNQVTYKQYDDAFARICMELEL